MNTQELFPYLLEVLMMSSIGSAGYLLIMRKESKLIWNRIYLIFLLILSIVLPFFTWSVPLPWTSEPVSEYLLAPVLLTPDDSIATSSYWSLGVLLAGMSVSIIVFSYKMISLLRFARSCTTGIRQEVEVLLTNGRLTTSSFGKWLFWDETAILSPEQETMMLRHEQCHIQQRHSWDLLLAELVLIPFWWNPAFHLIRFLIVSNHETLADQAVVTEENQISYRRLLLRQWLRPQFALTHEFHLSHIKHRIDMLFTFSTHRHRPWKYLAAIPILLLGSVIISCQGGTVAEEASAIAEPQLEEVIEMDNMPQPLNLREIKQAIGYPQIAMDAKIQGQVVARILIGPSGEYIRHEVVKSDHDILKWAVEEQISELEFEPALKDGEGVKFWLNIPFNFVLLD